MRKIWILIALLFLFLAGCTQQAGRATEMELVFYEQQIIDLQKENEFLRTQISATPSEMPTAPGGTIGIIIIWEKDENGDLTGDWKAVEASTGQPVIPTGEHVSISMSDLNQISLAIKENSVLRTQISASQPAAAPARVSYSGPMDICRTAKVTSPSGEVNEIKVCKKVSEPTKEKIGEIGGSSAHWFDFDGSWNQWLDSLDWDI